MTRLPETDVFVTIAVVGGETYIYCWRKHQLTDAMWYPWIASFDPDCSMTRSAADKICYSMSESARQ